MSPPSSLENIDLLDAASLHARLLELEQGETERSDKHEEACAQRQIEFQDQADRSLVVRRGLLTIHFVCAIFLLLIALSFIGTIPTSLLIAVLTLASVLISASTKCITCAIRSHRAPDYSRVN